MVCSLILEIKPIIINTLLWGRLLIAHAHGRSSWSLYCWSFEIILLSFSWAFEFIRRVDSRTFQVVLLDIDRLSFEFVLLRRSIYGRPFYFELLRGFHCGSFYLVIKLWWWLLDFKLHSIETGIHLRIVVFNNIYWFLTLA